MSSNEPLRIACCKNCLFFSECSSSGGYCKRYPPQCVSFNDDTVSYCDPMVRKDEWCGEFKLNPLGEKVSES